jgi:hypothetical protein
MLCATVKAVMVLTSCKWHRDDQQRQHEQQMVDSVRMLNAVLQYRAATPKVLGRVGIVAPAAGCQPLFQLLPSANSMRTRHRHRARKSVNSDLLAAQRLRTAQTPCLDCRVAGRACGYRCDPFGAAR